MSKEAAPKVHVRISKATQNVWEGDAAAVSSTNADGPFDILPMHANFITLVKSQPITVHSQEGGTKEYNFDQAVIYVNNDQVKIYADFT